MRRYRFVSHLHIGHVLLQTIIWLALSIVTFGVALPFFAYYFVRLVINTTEVIEEEPGSFRPGTLGQ